MPIRITEPETWLQPYYLSKLQSCSYVEKRQLFLRSYQFSRKQSLGQRIRKSFVKLRHTLWLRIRYAKKARKLAWAGLRFALRNKRRRLSRFVNYHFNSDYSSTEGKEFKYELFYASPAPSCLLW